MCALLLEHLEQLYIFYGEDAGVRIARKHLGWYCGTRPGGAALRSLVNQTVSSREQLAAVRDLFDRLETQQDPLAA